MSKPCLVLQLQIGMNFSILSAAHFAFLDEPLILQRRELIHVEVSINRIDADNGS